MQSRGGVGVAKGLLVMLVLAASSAHGEIYTWTDSRGTAHYTNSIYEVPARYRAKARVLDLGVEKKTEAASPPEGQPQSGRPLEPSMISPTVGTNAQSSPMPQPTTVVPEELRLRKSRRR